MTQPGVLHQIYFSTQLAAVMQYKWFLLDGISFNHTLGKDGWAWRYRKYAPGETVLEGLEKEARG